ncbi:hypothetical protein RFI_09514 [Reticulomyxa filosa]|uniref:Uncharacterized protein n=1 Tax=Reticulomyxa filosa TaxID=46433 RepID=X6NMX8_RETFI|nr:hypothetical protein RFI_09514 [Reticulomyxa filosa]|eukprot:ETO27620.1 hypothetical protein RFI_09514 [Reticulomyxa filosa]
MCITYIRVYVYISNKQSNNIIFGCYYCSCSFNIYMKECRELKKKGTFEEINSHIQMLWYRFLASNAPQQVNISHGNYQAIQHCLFPHLVKNCRPQNDSPQPIVSNRIGDSTNSAEGVPNEEDATNKQATSSSKRGNFILDEILTIIPEPMPVIADHTHHTSHTNSTSSKSSLPASSSSPVHVQNGNDNSSSIHNSPMSPPPPQQQQQQQQGNANAVIPESNGKRHQKQNLIKRFDNKKDVLSLDLCLNSAEREVSSLINGNLLTRFSESKYYQRYFIEQCSQRKANRNLQSAKTTNGKTNSSSTLISHPFNSNNAKYNRRFSLF